MGYNIKEFLRDLSPITWLKGGDDREDWARRAAMIATAFGGAGAAGAGPLAGLLGGSTAAAGGASAAGAGGAASGILGSGASTVGTGVGSGALIPGSSIAASAGTGLGVSAPVMGAPASFMNPALMQAGNPAALSAMSGGSSFGSMMGKGLSALGDAGKTYAMTNSLMGGGQQGPMPPPPRPMAPPAPPMPTGGGYSGGMDAPPGVDPMMWARMTDEQKRALLAQGRMA